MYARAVPDKYYLVTPAVERFGPWIGQLVSVTDTPLRHHLPSRKPGRRLNRTDTVVLRCVDPLKAKGMIQGEDYVVMLQFLRTCQAPS